MGVQSKKGVPRIGNPPQDGREWVCRDDAMKRFDCSITTLRKYIKRFAWIVFCPPDNSQMWILKSEIEPWAKFLQERDNWRKKRRPKHWQMMYMMVDDETARRIFLSSTQVAAMLKVSVSMVRQLSQRGKLAVYPSKKVGRGSRYWYSPTGIKNYLEDEERAKWRAVYEKGMETRRRRREEGESKPIKSHRKYRGIPEGWLMAWEVAERMGISECSVWRMRRKGAFFCERFPLRRGRMSPWCFSEVGVKELMEDEGYMKLRQIWAAREPKSEDRPVSVPNRVPLEEVLERMDAAQERIRSQMEW